MTVAASDDIVTLVADRLAIEDLVVRYAKARDTTAAEIYQEIFAADAQIRLPNGKVLSDGIEQILAVVETDKQRFNPERETGGARYGVMRHIVTNVDIRLSWDTATSDYYVMTVAWNANAKRPEIVSQARNVDTYAKRNGHWLIVSSTLNYDWGNDEMAQLLAVGPYTPAQYKR